VKFFANFLSSKIFYILPYCSQQYLRGISAANNTCQFYHFFVHSFFWADFGISLLLNSDIGVKVGLLELEFVDLAPRKIMCTFAFFHTKCSFSRE